MLHDSAFLGAPSAGLFTPDHWKSLNRLDGEALGRGTTWFIREGRGWVLRHYRRGGLIGRIVTDRYVWTGEERTRAFLEWRLLHALHAQGLPVPRPIAAHVRHDGMYYRADLLTERIPDSVTLSSLLSRCPLPNEDWRALGTLLKRFGRAGVVHADLNAHNVLRKDSGDFFLIDFDRGRQTNDTKAGDRGLRRLQQSLEKLSRQSASFQFTADNWKALETSYRE